MGDPQPWNAIEDSNPSNGELAPVCTARVAFWLDFSIAYVRLFCAALRPLDCGSWLTNGLRFFRASLTWGPGCWRLSAPGQRYARTDLARHRMYVCSLNFCRRTRLWITRTSTLPSLSRHSQPRPLLRPRRPFWSPQTRKKPPCLRMSLSSLCWTLGTPMQEATRSCW